MTVIVKNAGKFEGVHYAANSVLQLADAVELRMVTEGFAVWQTPPDTLSNTLSAVIGPNNKVKKIRNPDGTDSLLLNTQQESAGAIAIGAVTSIGEILKEDGKRTGIAYITGNLTFGSVLTARLLPGWSVTGYQWTRDGVDIAGATNSTYTLVAADIGKTIAVRVANPSYASVATDSILYTGPSLLRFASPFNKAAADSIGTSAGIARFYGARVFRPIGSGAKKSLRVRIDNMYLDSTDRVANGGQPLSVVGMFVECNGRSVQVTWSGDTVPNFAAGSFDNVSDPLLPAQFGLTTFAQNRSVFIRGLERVPAGGRIPVSQGIENESQAFYFSEGSGQVTNLSGTGALTYSGTGQTSWFEPNWILLGEQEDIVADARVWLGYGNSIFAQGGAGSYLQEALRGNNTNYIAGCALAKVGGNFGYILYAQNELRSFMKYANGLVEEMGTNNLAFLSMGAHQGYLRDTWAFFRSGVSTHPFSRSLRVLRVPLGLSTFGSFGTLAGQTPNSDWNAGAKVEQYNDFCLAQVGVAGGVDHFAESLWESPNRIRGSLTGKGTAGSDYYKWRENFTGDGLHPNSTAASGITGLGANLRAHLLLPENL